MLFTLQILGWPFHWQFQNTSFIFACGLLNRTRTLWTSIFGIHKANSSRKLHQDFTTRSLDYICIKSNIQNLGSCLMPSPSMAILVASLLWTAPSEIDQGMQCIVTSSKSNSRCCHIATSWQIRATQFRMHWNSHLDIEIDDVSANLVSALVCMLKDIWNTKTVVWKTSSSTYRLCDLKASKIMYVFNEHIAN